MHFIPIQDFFHKNMHVNFRKKILVWDLTLPMNLKSVLNLYAYIGLFWFLTTRKKKINQSYINYRSLVALRVLSHPIKKL